MILLSRKPDKYYLKLLEDFENGDLRLECFEIPFLTEDKSINTNISGKIHFVVRNQKIDYLPLRRHTDSGKIWKPVGMPQKFKDNSTNTVKSTKIIFSLQDDADFTCWEYAMITPNGDVNSHLLLRHYLRKNTNPA
ncbi:hypothetical protein PPL_11420 [Heterostelium album PN500]|uniref:Uncharacterized protein n=1 Tax=Heterostelium pallidum (strain ATCC 26659 / Pp 5 / PN500) TaxID=670386 RepID=D3BTC7_HETP5|nr:hypothetical protein PPL_11420 [Heterostelium album PN500]EFA75344.1 hypothetical protein PPL_11420 [Heterostelium album PN500]|eukprot:XP_020427478.1 hypothetical protein PPL_11420 [Heterostelium album PN500]